jgi:hypothetical protein
MEAVMTKLSHEEKKRIIKRALPGYKLVEQAKRGSSEDLLERETRRPKPDVGTPDFRELRRKYFGTTEDSEYESDAGPREAGGNPGNDSDDDEIVQVAPENSADPLDRGARPKSVVISKGEVKGSQG